jgi:hypoxanthine-DNA glycosylase
MAHPEQIDWSAGFPPIAGTDAKILILGSLPGQRSLELAQYYAHRQNAFWRIMAELFGVEGDYASRCHQLMAQRIAVWDVLASSVRPGSMDADIRLDTAEVNDFARFLSDHVQIERICFNGRKAEQLFRKLVVPALAGNLPDLVSLPSTSPAYAALSFDNKLEIWAGLLVTTMPNRIGRETK